MLERNTAPSSEPRLNSRNVLYGGAASAITMVAITALVALLHLRQQAEIRAETATRDLAISMELTIEGVMDAVDIALQVSADEVGKQIDSGRIDSLSISRFLTRQKERLPRVDHLWATNDRGEVVFGEGISNPPASISDRDYFLQLRDNSNVRMVMPNPVIGKTNKKWFLPLARRITTPDGHFAGVVFAAINIDQLEEVLAQVDMAAGGSIALRTADLGLIARRQYLTPDFVPIGDKQLSKPFVKALKDNPQEGTYISGPTSVDGISRTHSYYRSVKYGFVVNVGLSRTAVFADWHKQVMVAVGFAATFVIVTLVFLLLITHLWRRQEQYMAVLKSSRESLHEAQKTAKLGHFSYNQHTDQWQGSDILDEIFGIESDYPRDAHHWLALVAPEFRGELKIAFNGVIKQHPPLDNEFRIIRPKDGEERWVHGISKPQLDDEGNVVAIVGTIQDITSRKEAEEKINELAFFDQLTGLPNRGLLFDRLKQAMTIGERSGNYGALLFIDLDNFKTLNDTLGHDRGDLLLKLVAERLNSYFRAGDTVARLGGDEFVLMVPSLNTDIVSDAAAQAEIMGAKVLSALNEIYQLDVVPYRCTSSIGVTLFRGHDASIDDLLKQADLAMYKAKAAGRNTICFFDQGMESAVLEQAQLEADLREAISQKQFTLHYQAQVVGDGAVIGAEALLRWQNPRRGIVSPSEFIPLAEETGLILPLGQWVLETACQTLALWAERPEFDELTLSVNVSARQFHQTHFVDQVLEVLAKTGAPPKRLKLELTESLLVENVQDIIEKMFALRAKGVGFSLDDFGTGYSSLSYLKRLPLDQLKIDRSFVHDVLSDPHDATIAKTIVTLAQSLGLGVIAEGVETEAQRDFLANAGCVCYQGYLYSRPIPAEAFDEFVTTAIWRSGHPRVASA
jgi:diguanylate cyclase (GGDEF)-like protein/PAS domain S-box-containing protein